MSTQSTQSAINEALRKINTSIMDFKLSVDKSMANLKASVDQVNANVVSVTTKFQEFETRLNVTELRMEETEQQSISNYKEVTKYELEV